MIVVSEQVRSALADRVPVVALESTIYSTLGLPVPHNAEALRRARPRSWPAVPSRRHRGRRRPVAGRPERAEAGARARRHRKVAERDLAVAAASRGTSASRRVGERGARRPRRHRGVRHRRHRRRAPRGRGERRRLRRPRRARLPPGRHGLRRARSRSSTSAARSSTWRPPACRCSAGAPPTSRRSTSARAGCRAPRRRDGRRGRPRAARPVAPQTGVLLTSRSRGRRAGPRAPRRGADTALEQAAQAGSPGAR
jgi:hypothetical protein